MKYTTKINYGEWKTTQGISSRYDGYKTFKYNINDNKGKTTQGISSRYDGYKTFKYNINDNKGKTTKDLMLESIGEYIKDLN